MVLCSVDIHVHLSTLKGKLEWLQLVIKFVYFVAYIVGFQCNGVFFSLLKRSLQKASHHATSLE